MKWLVLAAMLALLSACGDGRPAPLPSGGPDDATAPSADRPYRPVLSGTVIHGIGDRP
jgi:predicted small lipoprotein YifL